MADDMNKQQGNQTGQGQPGQKPGHTGETGHSGQQQKGNVDPNKKNPAQDDEQEERDRQRRAS